MEQLLKEKTTQELTELALAEISRLCQSGNWRMCVPVQWNDSDVLLHGTIKRLEAENATLKKLLQISEEVVKQHNEERGMMTYVTLMEAHLIERLSKTLNDLNKALTLLESAKYALEIEGALDEEWNAKVVALLKASVDRKRDQLGAE